MASSLPSPTSSSSSSLMHGGARAPSVAGSRRPRPRSPPSMYVPYDTPIAKPPKPLIKLDKKPKDKASKGPRTTPASAPPAQTTALSSGSDLGHGAGSRMRPSFFSLRHKPSVPSTTTSSPTSPIPLVGTLAESQDEMADWNTRSRRAARAPPVDLHDIKADIEADEGIQEVRRSDTSKPARMRGRARACTLDSAPLPRRDGLLVANDSESFRIPSRGISPAQLGERQTTRDLPSGKRGLIEEVRWDNDGTESEADIVPPSPVKVYTPSSSTNADSDDGAPRTDPPPRASSRIRQRIRETPAESFQMRETALPLSRPDTPFIDAFVEVNVDSAALAVVVKPAARASSLSRRRGIGAGHSRDGSTSVIRTETGWMGEWNQGDMREVISRLRELK